MHHLGQPQRPYVQQLLQPTSHLIVIFRVVKNALAGCREGAERRVSHKVGHPRGVYVGVLLNLARELGLVVDACPAKITPPASQQ